MEKCNVCKETIQDGAAKCVHCGSYQNWRRYLNLSSAVLALLVALFSVSGLVLPKLIKTFERKNTKIDVTFKAFKTNQKFYENESFYSEAYLTKDDEVDGMANYTADDNSFCVYLILSNFGNKYGYISRVIVNFKRLDKAFLSYYLVVPQELMINPKETKTMKFCNDDFPMPIQAAFTSIYRNREFFETEKNKGDIPIDGIEIVSYWYNYDGSTGTKVIAIDKSDQRADLPYSYSVLWAKPD